MQVSCPQTHFSVGCTAPVGMRYDEAEQHEIIAEPGTPAERRPNVDGAQVRSATNGLRMQAETHQLWWVRTMRAAVDSYNSPASQTGSRVAPSEFSGKDDIGSPLPPESPVQARGPGPRSPDPVAVTSFADLDRSLRASEAEAEQLRAQIARDSRRAEQAEGRVQALEAQLRDRPTPSPERSAAAPPQDSEPGQPEQAAASSQAALETHTSAAPVGCCAGLLAVLRPVPPKPVISSGMKRGLVHPAKHAAEKASPPPAADAGLRERIAELEAKNAAYAEEQQALAAEHKTLRARHVELEGDVAAKKEAHEAATVESERRRAAHEALGKELEEVQSQLARSRVECEGHASHQAAQAVVHDSVIEERESFARAHEEATGRAEAHSAENAVLRAELELLRDERQTALRQADEHAEALAQARQDLSRQHDQRSEEGSVTVADDRDQALRTAAECAVLQSEVDRLKSENQVLAAVREEATRLNAQHERLQSEHTRLEDENLALANAKEQADRALAECESLQAQAETLRVENDLLKSGHAEAAHLHSEVERLRNENALLPPARHRAESTAVEHDAMRAEAERLRAENAVLAARCDEISDLHQQQQQYHVAGQEELQHLRSENEVLRSAQAEVGDLISELEQLRKEYGDLTAYCEQVERINMQYKAEVERLESDNSALSELQEHLGDSAAEREMMQDEIENLRAANASYCQQAEQEASLRMDQAEQLRVQDEALASCRDQYEQAVVDCAALQAETERLRQDNETLVSLHEEAAAVVSENGVLRQELDSLTAANAVLPALQEQLEQSHVECETLSAEAERLRAENLMLHTASKESSAQPAQLEAQLEAHQAEVERLREDIAALQRGAQEQAEDMGAEVDAIKAEAARLGAENMMLQAARDQLEQVLAHNDELRTEKSRLESEHSEAHSARNRAEQLAAEFAAKAEEAAVDATSSKAEILQLHKEKERLQKEKDLHEAARKDAEQLVQEANKRSESHSALMAKLEDHEKALNAERLMTQQLRHDNFSLEDARQQAEDVMAKAVEAGEALQSEVQRLNEANEYLTTAQSMGIGQSRTGTTSDRAESYTMASPTNALGASADSVQPAPVSPNAVEVWVANYTPPPVAGTAGITYMGKVPVAFADFASLLGPVAAANSYLLTRMAELIESGELMRSALEALKMFDKDCCRGLQWGGGDVTEFVASVFLKHGFIPPTDAQVGQMQPTFPSEVFTGRLVPQSCLCLVDALFRAVVCADVGLGGPQGVAPGSRDLNQMRGPVPFPSRMASGDRSPSSPVTLSPPQPVAPQPTVAMEPIACTAQSAPFAQPVQPAQLPQQLAPQERTPRLLSTRMPAMASGPDPGAWRYANAGAPRMEPADLGRAALRAPTSLDGSAHSMPSRMASDGCGQTQLPAESLSGSARFVVQAAPATAVRPGEFTAAGGPGRSLHPGRVRQAVAPGGAPPPQGSSFARWPCADSSIIRSSAPPPGSLLQPRRIS